MERKRTFFDAVLYFVEYEGVSRTAARLRGEKVDPEVDLRTRTPEQIVAGESTPHDPPPLVSCLGGAAELDDEDERRVKELLRRGKESLPALTKALSAKDPERVRFALIALRRGGLPVPEAVPALDRLLSDPGLGKDAALVLWNSGPKGRAVIETAVFYPPPLPPLPRRGDDSPAAQKVHEMFDVHIKRKDAATVPFYRDADSGFDILRRALESGPHGARYAAAYQFRHLKTRRAEGAAVLAAALERETDFLPRAAMMGALERMGPDAAAAAPVLRRLAGSRETSEDAVWALFALTGSDEDLARLLAVVEAKGRLDVTNLDTFAKACPRSARARVLMEKAYGEGGYRDGYAESRWKIALGDCLGTSLTPEKQAALDAAQVKARKARLEKSRKG